MRILTFVNGFPGPGDPATGIFVLKQLEALRSLGFRTKIIRFVPLAPPFGRWKKYSVPLRYTVDDFEVFVRRVVLGPRFRMLRYIGLQMRPLARRLIDRFQPDIIHAHQLIPTGLLGINLGLPLVVTAHGSDAYDYPFRNAETQHLARAVLGSAQKVVAVSSFIAGKINQLGATADVVFNGADESVFRPGNREDAQRRWGYSGDTPILTFVGAIEENKGIRDFILSLSRVRDLNPVVFIAGKGSLASYASRQLANLNLRHHMLGVVSQQTLGHLFRASSAIVLPSYREGLPAVVCEAMMSGRVVITTPVGGIPEIVKDHSTGILVPPGAVDALSDEIRSVLQNQEMRAEIERNARDFALAHLTWEANARAYNEIFQSLFRRQE
jgi:glycosyltransferase involved in cell wall biosynthesis